MCYPDRQLERTVKAALSVLDLPNLRRIYLNELPLLDSSNPKLWLIALIVSDEPQLPAIVEKVALQKNLWVNFGSGKAPSV